MDDIAKLLSRVAALEENLAKLYQHLNLPQAEKENRRLTASPPPLPSPAPFDIISVDAKPTESNSVWTKWSWRLKVHNRTSGTIIVQAQIQFRDRELFALDSYNSEPLTLRPGEQIFTAYHMVDASIAHLVDSIYATVTPLT